MKPRTHIPPIFFKIFSLFLAFLLLFFSILLIFSPPKIFSESENRALARFSPPTIPTLLDASFFRRLSLACSDQFPFREGFCKLKARAERALGKRENNGVLYGADGYLISKNDDADLTVLCANLAAIGRFRESASLPVTTMLVPRCLDVMSEALPLGFRADPAVEETVARADVADLIPTEQLRTGSEHAPVFYKTDHHWTTHGAYLAYTALAPLLGVEPYAEQYFTQALVSDSFFGTSDAAVGGIAADGDEITLYRYPADESFLCTDPQTGRVSKGLYDLSALSARDQYRVFLGGNTALLSIESDDASSQERPRLLLIKDSFANSLVPFLALHYDLLLVDLRYGISSLSEILSEQAFDRVLIVQGIGTLTTDRSIAERLCR